MDGALTVTHICVDSSRTVLEHHRSFIPSTKKRAQGSIVQPLSNSLKWLFLQYCSIPVGAVDEAAKFLSRAPLVNERRLVDGIQN